MRCFFIAVFSSLGLLAGCAASPTPALSTADGYSGQIVAVRTVTTGPLTARVADILGQPGYVSPTVAREIVVRLANGDVKAFVPPPGAAPSGLVPGEHIVVTDTPTIKLSIR